MREKLIEILRKSVYKWQTDFDFGFEEMADHLIANGVTVTDNNVGCKWIPVTERLPEKYKLVLCVGKKGGMFLGEIYPFLSELGENEAYCYVPNSRHGRYATHWMPLPEPPKGE